MASSIESSKPVVSTSSGPQKASSNPRLEGLESKIEKDGFFKARGPIKVTATTGPESGRVDRAGKSILTSGTGK